MSYKDSLVFHNLNTSTVIGTGYPLVASSMTMSQAYLNFMVLVINHGRKHAPNICCPSGKRQTFSSGTVRPTSGDIPPSDSRFAKHQQTSEENTTWRTERRLLDTKQIGSEKVEQHFINTRLTRTEKFWVSERFVAVRFFTGVLMGVSALESAEAGSFCGTWKCCLKMLEPWWIFSIETKPRIRFRTCDVTVETFHHCRNQFCSISSNLAVYTRLPTGHFF